VSDFPWQDFGYYILTIIVFTLKALGFLPA
jgi:hypothetical protein